MEAFGYFSALTESRRQHPKDDLASLCPMAQSMANRWARWKPSAITPSQPPPVTTPSNSTSAGMIALCEQPDLLMRLQDDPTLIPGFVEESIRWESPVKHFMRSATATRKFAALILKKMNG